MSQVKLSQVMVEALFISWVLSDLSSSSSSSSSSTSGSEELFNNVDVLAALCALQHGTGALCAAQRSTVEVFDTSRPQWKKWCFTGGRCRTESYSLQGTPPYSGLFCFCWRAHIQRQIMIPWVQHYISWSIKCLLSRAQRVWRPVDSLWQHRENQQWSSMKTNSAFTLFLEEEADWTLPFLYRKSQILQTKRLRWSLAHQCVKHFVKPSKAVERLSSINVKRLWLLFPLLEWFEGGELHTSICQMGVREGGGGADDGQQRKSWDSIRERLPLTAPEPQNNQPIGGSVRSRVVKRTFCH